VDFLHSVAAIIVVSVVSDERNSFFVRDRQKWELFAAHLIEEYYCMEKSSFYKLVLWISPLFTLDIEMSGRRTDWRQQIGIEIILQCTLRYLAGSSADNIRIACGISRPSFLSLCSPRY
jgi:hypothetical protein